jgi:hypothetical protein
MRNPHSGAHRLPPQQRDPSEATVSRIHPELPDTVWVPEEEVQAREAAAMLAGFTASVSHLPPPLTKAFRTGDPDEPVTIRIGDTPVTLILSGPGTLDPKGELAAWLQLREAMEEVEAAFTASRAHHLNGWTRADLPDQIAVAIWEYKGRLIRARGPRCTIRHRRIARGQRPRQNRLAAVGGTTALGLVSLAERIGAGTLATNTLVGAAIVGVGAAAVPAVTDLTPPGGVHGSITTGIITGTSPPPAGRPSPKETLEADGEAPLRTARPTDTPTAGTTPGTESATPSGSPTAAPAEPPAGEEPAASPQPTSPLTRTPEKPKKKPKKTKPAPLIGGPEPGPGHTKKPHPEKPKAPGNKPKAHGPKA